jgi:hypothetical protein
MFDSQRRSLSSYREAKSVQPNRSTERVSNDRTLYSGRSREGFDPNIPVTYRSCFARADGRVGERLSPASHPFVGAGAANCRQVWAGRWASRRAAKHPKAAPITRQIWPFPPLAPCSSCKKKACCRGWGFEGIDLAAQIGHASRRSGPKIRANKGRASQGLGCRAFVTFFQLTASRLVLIPLTQRNGYAL